MTPYLILYDVLYNRDNDKTYCEVLLLGGFLSCQKISEIIEGRKETPLLKLLRQLGGWPVVDGDTWYDLIGMYLQKYFY